MDTVESVLVFVNINVEMSVSVKTYLHPFLIE